MTSLLNFHAIAAVRGDGLHPALRAVLERVAAAPCAEFAVRNDGMIQSGPDPVSAEVTKARTDVSPPLKTSQNIRGVPSPRPLPESVRSRRS